MNQHRKLARIAMSKSKAKWPSFMQDKPKVDPDQSAELPPQYQDQINQYADSSKESEDRAYKATQRGLEAHRAEAGKHLSETGRKFFELIEFDENEELVLEIRKHPFGLVFIWLAGIFVTLILLFVPVLLAAFLAGNASTIGANNTSSIQAILLIIGIILAGAGLIVTFINTLLYKNNVIYVTSEKIAQVVYVSLFNRKISQLSIGDIQDVTVRQYGIFPRAFNYGSLTIETSGEQQNYQFDYVPAPYDCSKQIVSAHEENLKQYGN